MRRELFAPQDLLRAIGWDGAEQPLGADQAVALVRGLHQFGFITPEEWHQSFVLPGEVFLEFPAEPARPGSFWPSSGRPDTANDATGRRGSSARRGVASSSSTPAEGR